MHLTAPKSDEKPCGEETAVSFEPLTNFPGWEGGPPFIKSLILRNRCTSILEVGSGANPTIESQFVRDHKLRYVTSDLSSDEMNKADPAYERMVLNISTDSIHPLMVGQFDLVFSRMVGEHVSDGQKFHQNIHTLLRPGGISAHCFSTLWALPFTANRILPEFLSDRVLKAFAPRNRHRQAKFPALYSWSRGPSATMIRRFEELGFEVLKYTGYFGHMYYKRLAPLLHRLEIAKAELLLRHPVPTLCSYATVVLRKR
jgi:2-polyprenyl-3-methyl-5-hydroxy-6-metoxy-1,4-benzoquinol methylase